ncbi:MAG TPA: lysophospholipid acyltransferase family protein [Kiloniellaceae bacterium]|nr:lysophospholipid acyltransferase family protein [Kiloniellaceae bacterium]
MTQALPQQPILSYANPADPLERRLFIGAVEKMTGQLRLKRLYRHYQLHGDKTASFWDEAVKRLGLKLDCDMTALAKIPKSGPLVVVANHPFGVIDGLVLCHLVSRIRPDIKVMAHEVLLRAPEIREFILPISFTGSRAARVGNIESCRRAIAHVKSGGPLVIFPSGGIATAERLFGRAVDLPWQPFAARVMIAARATVLPVYFEGQNSHLFQAVSRLSQPGREALLMREAARRIGSAVPLRIGAPIPFETLERMGDAEAILHQLRQITYGLDAKRRDGGDAGQGTPFDRNRLRRLVARIAYADGNEFLPIFPLGGID